MKRIFFTADTHFGHANIIKYVRRPFLGPKDKEELERIGDWHNGIWKSQTASKWKMSQEAVELMDNTLIDQINATVGPDDTLYHLGDFCMYSKHQPTYKYYQRCKAYRDRIKCRNVHLIWGNHDEEHPKTERPIIEDLFSSARIMRTIPVCGERYKIVLCHYAMAIWPKSHRGNLCLYGHSHSEAEHWLGNVMPGRRSMDVGVDNAAKLLGAYRPFSLEEIKGLLVERPGFGFDHHVSEIANTPEEETLN